MKIDLATIREALGLYQVTGNSLELTTYLQQHPKVAAFLPTLRNFISEYFPDSQPAIEVYADICETPEGKTPIQKVRVWIYERNNMSIPEFIDYLASIGNFIETCIMENAHRNVQNQIHIW